MKKEDYLDIFEKYIQHKASPEEIDLLQSYIRSDLHLNKWLEEQIMSSSDDVDAEVKMRMLKNIHSNLNYTKEKKLIVKSVYSPRYSLRWIANIAAVFLLIAIAFSIYLYLKPQNIDSLEISSGLGEKANVTLSDGSKVSINSDSRVVYFNNYNQKDRYLRLSGEAYFDVKTNPSKPFIVECSDLIVEVLGTTFGINSYEDKNTISVVLNSGKVKLTIQTETFTMEPNDRIIYDKTTKNIQKVSVNATDYTDWRYNRLRFDHKTMLFDYSILNQPFVLVVIQNR